MRRNGALAAEFSYPLTLRGPSEEGLWPSMRKAMALFSAQPPRFTISCTMVLRSDVVSAWLTAGLGRLFQATDAAVFGRDHILLSTVPKNVVALSAASPSMGRGGGAAG